jgi:hypothetical protein
VLAPTPPCAKMTRRPGAPGPPASFLPPELLPPPPCRRRVAAIEARAKALMVSFGRPSGWATRCRRIHLRESSEYPQTRSAATSSRAKLRAILVHFKENNAKR